MLEPDPQERHELMMLLGQAVEEGTLPPEREQRLHEIMLRYNPGYAILRREKWVDAGLILLGSWRLAEVLAETSES